MMSVPSATNRPLSGLVAETACVEPSAVERRLEQKAQKQMCQENSQRWADVADSDEEDGDDIDIEDIMPMPSKQRLRAANTDEFGSEATTATPTSSRFASSLSDDVACSVQSESSSTNEPAMRWNPEASEFIPTLSYRCMGVCEVEESAEVGATTEPRKNRRRKQKSSRSRLSSMAVVDEEGTFVTEEQLAGKAADGMMPEVSEEVWEHRVEMRLRELMILKDRVLRSVDATCKPEIAARRRIEIESATMPDHTDRTVSRRAWRRGTHDWYKALMAQWCPEDSHSGNVSSDERQSTEAASTNCDVGSECSSD